MTIDQFKNVAANSICWIWCTLPSAPEMAPQLVKHVELNVNVYLRFRVLIWEKLISERRT